LMYRLMRSAQINPQVLGDIFVRPQKPPPLPRQQT